LVPSTGLIRHLDGVFGSIRRLHDDGLGRLAVRARANYRSFFI